MYPKRSGPPASTSSPALELVRVSNQAAGVRDVSLSVGRGEIVGLAGLAGCGRSELAETIFGLTPADSGEIRIRRRARADRFAGSRDRSTASATCRKTAGSTASSPEMSVTENTGLASLKAVSRAGIDSSRARAPRRRRLHGAAADQGAVRRRSRVDALSGGNQQKVALARWLMTGARILILDEPTQGVDVGAKAEIHALIADLVGAAWRSS